MALVKPPAHIEAMDWRINNLTWTTAPFVDPATGNTVPAESAVTQAALLTLGAKRGGISVPNATAMFLDLSKLHLDQAQEFVDACKTSNDQHGHLPEADAFGAIENYMASVVFACTALEAFANELLPDSFVYVIKKNDSDRRHNKEQIERWLTPLEKLGDVLPQALNVATPKGGKLWELCRKLFDLRDRIVHMKSADRQFHGDATSASSIWNELLQDPLPNTYSVSKALMGHFFSVTGKSPRWFEKLPF